MRILSTTTCWRAAGRLERITDALYAGYHPEDRAVFADPLPRLRPPAAFEDAQTLALRQSDLDYNGHVHNTRYLEFALEALPPGREFTRLSVVYNRPLAAQETVTLRHTAAGETHTLGVFAGSDLCTLLVLE